VLLPGLNGYSGDAYLVTLGKGFIRKGFQVVIYLSRLNRRDLTFPKNGHINNVDDFYHSMQYLQRKHPKHSFMAVGHSYGANLLVNYLGIYSKENIFKAAVSLSNPLNLLSAETKIRGSVYDQVLLKASKTACFRYRESFQTSPSSMELDITLLENAKMLCEFNGHFQCKLYGFESVEDYYWEISSTRRLKYVKVPLLIINAEDDPLVEAKELPRTIEKVNEQAIVLLTRKGGHLGWFTGFFKPRQWHVQPTLEFLEYVESCVK